MHTSTYYAHNNVSLIQASQLLIQQFLQGLFSWTSTVLLTAPPNIIKGTLSTVTRIVVLSLKNNYRCFSESLKLQNIYYTTNTLKHQLFLQAQAEVSDVLLKTLYGP